MARATADSRWKSAWGIATTSGAWATARSAVTTASATSPAGPGHRADPTTTARLPSGGSHAPAVADRRAAVVLPSGTQR